MEVRRQARIKNQERLAKEHSFDERNESAAVRDRNAHRLVSETDEDVVNKGASRRSHRTKHDLGL